MKPPLSLVLLTLTVSSLLPLSAERFLEIASADGKLTIKAELVSLTKESATLRTSKNGEFKEMKTPLGLLSPKSVALLKKTWAANADAIKDLNEAVGHALFSPSGNLWLENATEVANRLRLPEESKTPYTSSYRRYTRQGYQFLGTFPRTVVAYGNKNGKTESLSLMYSNKGDTLSTVGSGENHFTDNGKKVSRSTLKGAMRYDEKIITDKLSAILGEPKRQRLQAQGTDKITTQRWDWKGHSFLLAHVDDEYVNLKILKSSFADEKGRKTREERRETNDKAMRKRLRESVVQKDNGDVYIDHIPMVDQGPKGYCAPATFERAMRHAEVPADMYLLATIATSEGGGTNPVRLFEEVESTTRRTGGRTAKEVSFRSLEPKKIKKHINKGIPILWGMRSLSAYNSTANRRTKERQTITDWQAWADTIEDEAKNQEREMSQEESNHHMCLIVGYNEATGEVAVSDSWGKRYNRRWVHYIEADAVNSGYAYIIDL